MLTDCTPSGVIFEAKTVGAIVRMTAIDVATGTEAVIQGPAAASVADLRQVALRKLVYILKRQQTEKEK